MNTMGYFNAAKEQYLAIRVADEDILEAEARSKKMSFKLGSELTYKIDGEGIEKRWFIGMLGEIVVSKVLTEWGLVESHKERFNLGKSVDFDSPDLIDYNLMLGCKTSTKGRVAKIKEYVKYSEIISVYDAPLKILYICGIATKEVLEKYSDINLLENSNIKLKKGTYGGKLGFNRYDKLLPFTLENLKSFKSDLTVHHNYFLPADQKSKIVTNSTFIEKQEDEIVFRSSTAEGMVESRIAYPLTSEGAKALGKLLKPKHYFIGYNLSKLFREFQMAWTGDALTVECIDVWELLSMQGEKFKIITMSTDYDEAMRLLWMLFKPVLPAKGLDVIDVRYCTLLWMLVN